MNEPQNDRSNGYEAAASEFAAARHRSEIGAATVRKWLQLLPPRADILELGCGDGVPISQVLIDGGSSLFAIDASPTLIKQFRKRFPDAEAVCEPVEDSKFFGRRFDAAVAVGLFFLLHEDAQRSLIGRVAAVIRPGGRFLFSSPAQKVEWTDVITGGRSLSLGADAYKAALAEAAFDLDAEYEDEGGNHYYDAVRSS